MSVQRRVNFRRFVLEIDRAVKDTNITSMSLVFIADDHLVDVMQVQGYGISRNHAFAVHSFRANYVTKKDEMELNVFDSEMPAFMERAYDAVHSRSEGVTFVVRNDDTVWYRNPFDETKPIRVGYSLRLHTVDREGRVTDTPLH